MNGAQRAGKDHDNNVANALHLNTPDEIRVLSTRGSGNTNYPAADLLIVDGLTLHDVELKKVSQKAANVGGYAYFEIDDFVDLPEPRWFGVSFANREMVVVSATGSEPTRAVAERMPSCFEATVTDGRQLRLTKPSADDWNSSQSGRADWRVVAETLELPIEVDD